MSDVLGRRLADALRAERLPDAPDSLRAFLEHLPADAGARPPQRRPLLAWVAAAATVVVVTALLFAVVPRGTTPSGSALPSASKPSATGIAWTQVATTVDGGILTEGDTVMGAIAFNGGYVMVGNGGQGDHAVWWSSSDGTTWQRHDSDPAFSGSLLNWVLPIPDGLLIVGTSNQADDQCAGGVFGCNVVFPLRMWTSPDGATWTRQPDADLAVFGRAGLNAVAAGPGGLVAFGARAPAEGDVTPLVWTSTDGRAWTAAPEFYTAFPTAIVDDVTATATRFVAVGRPDDPGGPSGKGAAWYSPDGRTWQAATGEPPLELARALGIAGGAIALGDAAAENASLWGTTDGTGWTPVGEVPFTLTDRTPSFVADDSRILAVGTDRASGREAAWLSSDGRSWQPLDATGDAHPPEPAGASGAVGPQGAVLVTYEDSPRAGVVSIWFGALGAAPPSQPTPTATPALPSPPPAKQTSTWTPVTLPTPPASGQPVGGSGGGISALPGGGFIDFVVNGPERTYVYTSSDGQHWTQRGTLTGPDASGIAGPVTSNGTVWVAMGFEGGGTDYATPYNGAAWVSPDLVHWTKAPAQQAFGGAGFRAIAASAQGFVAIGYDQGGLKTVWYSADGLHWTAESDARLFPSSDTEPTGIVHVATGFIIVGRIGGNAATWTSPDGRTWTLHSPPGGSGVYLDGLADGSAGLVTLAVGGSQVELAPDDVRSSVASWVSADGVTWQRGPSSAALFGATATIVAAPGGYVAAGTVGLDTGSFLWTSADGITWVPVAGVDLTGSLVDQLVSDGGHVLLVTRDANGQARALVSAGVER